MARRYIWLYKRSFTHTDTHTHFIPADQCYTKIQSKLLMKHTHAFSVQSDVSYATDVRPLCFIPGDGVSACCSAVFLCVSL